MRGGRLEFSRVVPIDDPRWRESLSGRSAARRRRGAGGGARSEAAQRLGDALAARLASPLFRESIPGGALPEVRLGGSGANRSHLIEKLQNELRVPVRAFSPWPLVRWGSPPADLAPYAAALALALAGVGAGGPRGSSSRPSARSSCTARRAGG